jgi:hypothetical protein
MKQSDKTMQRLLGVITVGYWLCKHIPSIQPVPSDTKSLAECTICKKAWRWQPELRGYKEEKYEPPK